MVVNMNSNRGLLMESIDIDNLIRRTFHIHDKNEFEFIPASKISSYQVDINFYAGRDSAERYEELIKHYEQISPLLFAGREPYDILMGCYDFYLNNNIERPNDDFFSGYWEIGIPGRTKTIFTQDEIIQLGLTGVSETEISKTLKELYDTIYVFFGSHPITLFKDTLGICQGRHRVYAAQTVNSSLELPCIIIDE